MKKCCDIDIMHLFLTKRSYQNEEIGYLLTLLPQVLVRYLSPYRLRRYQETSETIKIGYLNQYVSE